MNARAFCPGHITGFFEICQRADPLEAGSRGAGMCLSLGAISLVEVTDSPRQGVKVRIDGRDSRAEVTKAAVRRLLGNDRLGVGVTTILDLPVSQGFGMSAAGALSASLALADILGRDRQEAFEAAHIAEVTCRSGLGDVAALHKGGVTIRKRPGLPPIGEVARIDGTPDLVLCVVGKRLLTRSVLSNPSKRRAINRYGSKRVDALVKRPSLDRLMELSSSFAVESGLADRSIIEAMSAADRLGKASMAMLGNSVFATGDRKGLTSVLSEFGPIWTCKVDAKGPRTI